MLRLSFFFITSIWSVFALSQADIYFINTHTGIERLAYGSDQREVLVPADLVRPQGIALDVKQKKMYWTDWVAKKIQRANLDGSNIEDLIIEGLKLPEGIALDTEGKIMYWVDSGNKHICRANFDGTSVETLVEYDLVNLDGIALDVENEKMYWTEWGDGAAIGKVKRANLDGSNIEELIVIPGSLIKGIDLDLKSGKMYWTDCTIKRIQRANLNGSGIEDVILTSGTPNAIAVDTVHGEIYWTNLGLNKLFRAGTDGTGLEEVISNNLTTPQDLTLWVCSGSGQRSFGCSPTITSIRDQSLQTTTRVFPNPLVSTATIQYSGRYSGELFLQVFNLQGKLVLDLSTFNNQFLLRNKKLSPGLFFFVLRNSRGKFLDRGSICVIDE